MASERRIKKVGNRDRDRNPHRKQDVSRIKKSKRR